MENVRRLRVGEDNEAGVALDDLAREGARRIIAAALEAEVDDYVSVRWRAELMRVVLRQSLPALV